MKRVPTTFPLVMGITDDLPGYAPAGTADERVGRAALAVSDLLSALPFAPIHQQPAMALRELDVALQKGR